MKIRPLVVIASLFGMLIAGVVLDSSTLLLSTRLAEARPRCEACR
jgi:hypothetical protein